MGFCVKGSRSEQIHELVAFDNALAVICQRSPVAPPRNAERSVKRLATGANSPAQTRHNFRAGFVAN